MRKHVQFKVELVFNFELNSENSLHPVPECVCAVRVYLAPGSSLGYLENTVFGLFNCISIELNRVQLETRES